MPAGITQLIDRQVSASMNAGTGDVLPGQSVASGTGAAQYAGIVGTRIALDSQSVRFTASVGTLFGGIYEYVLHVFTTRQPTRGGAVFWDLTATEAAFQVNGDAKPTTAIPTMLAGVVLPATVVTNTYAWMQIGGRASCLFDSAITAAAAGNPVSVKISAAVASTFDVGVNVVTATIAFSYAGAYLGTAETTPVISTVSVVKIERPLIHRI